MDGSIFSCLPTIHRTIAADLGIAAVGGVAINLQVLSKPTRRTTKKITIAAQFRGTQECFFLVVDITKVDLHYHSPPVSFELDYSVPQRNQAEKIRGGI